MKLIVKKLWFPFNVHETIESLLSIPQMNEQFDEGYAYAGEMRPRGIKLCPGYWPADPILERLPKVEKDVFLVLTGLELKGQYGRIAGKGENRKAIASNTSFLYGIGHDNFDTDDVGFCAVAFSEIGHALGLQHHDFDHSNPCEMSHNEIPGPSPETLDEIRFCAECYQLLNSAR